MTKRILLTLAALLITAAPAFAQGKANAPGQVKKNGGVLVTESRANDGTLDGALVVTMQLTDTIKKSIPFFVVADQPAADAENDVATGFRLYLDGKVLQTLTAANAGCNSFPCSPRFSVPGGLGKGTYVIYMEAFNDDGAASSATITLKVTGAPPKGPGGIRIDRIGG